MKDLSIVQEYLICSFDKKGNLPMIGKEISTCVLAGSLIELLQAQVIKIDNRSISITSELVNELHYLKSIYNEINKHKSIEINNLIKMYVMSLTDKKLKILISDLCSELESKQCVTKHIGKVLFNSERFIPNEECVDYVVEKIRAELLEEGIISDEVIALVSLLDKSNLLKKYFSKYESKKIKQRLEEIKCTHSNVLVKQMIDYVDSIMSSITIFSSVL